MHGFYIVEDYTPNSILEIWKYFSHAHSGSRLQSMVLGKAICRQYSLLSQQSLSVVDRIRPASALEDIECFV